MCEPFSCILTREGKVLRHKDPNIHSHGRIASYHRLPHRNGINERLRLQKWVRIEVQGTVLDKGGDDMPTHMKKFTRGMIKVDEDGRPDWTYSAKSIQAVKTAYNQWRKSWWRKGYFFVDHEDQISVWLPKGSTIVRAFKSGNRIQGNNLNKVTQYVPTEGKYITFDFTKPLTPLRVRQLYSSRSSTKRLKFPLPKFPG